MKKIKRSLKAFFIAVMQARKEAAIQKAKSGLYHWD